MSESETTSAAEELEGIEREKTEGWLAANIAGLDAPFEWKRLTGGTSNLTYVVTDGAGRRAVLRRPPTGKLLPKAHDMGREFKIISALAPTDVPVAAPMGMCTDPEVTGAPFYVMEFRSGHTIRTTDEKYHPFSAAASARAGLAAIDALAALHAVVPDEVGLGDLGRPDAYVKRQLDRWADSYVRSNDAVEMDLPIESMHAELSKRIPEQGPARIAHGDYGPHNMLVDDEGGVTAVTDWEICTLGDPLADLGYFLNGWAANHAGSDVPYEEGRLAEGFSTRAELLDRYEQVTGRKLENLSFYVAFNYFKTTCIIHGVYARFARGVRSSQGIDLSFFSNRIEANARSAQMVLETL